MCAFVVPEIHHIQSVIVECAYLWCFYDILTKNWYKRTIQYVRCLDSLIDMAKIKVVDPMGSYAYFCVIILESLKFFHYNELLQAFFVYASTRKLIKWLIKYLKGKTHYVAGKKYEDNTLRSEARKFETYAIPIIVICDLILIRSIWTNSWNLSELS